MKGVITTMALVLLLACTASAREQSTLTRTSTREQPRLTRAAAREQSMLARVTVYWASGGRGSDRYTRQHKCATGIRLCTGHCAVDPRKIPYGSRIIFPDRSNLLAVDTGTAVISRKAARRAGRNPYEKSAVVVDRFFETKRQALAWARQNPAFMTVQVLPPNYRAQPVAQPNQQMFRNKASIASNSTSVTKPRPPLPKYGYRIL
jgi:3D (Asp-Asp-Asp) domain-containing protein